MGGSLRWLHVREKAAGKWQIPALFLAMGAMGLSLVTEPAIKGGEDAVSGRLGGPTLRGFVVIGQESPNRQLAGFLRGAVRLRGAPQQYYAPELVSSSTIDRIPCNSIVFMSSSRAAWSVLNLSSQTIEVPP